MHVVSTGSADRTRRRHRWLWLGASGAALLILALPLLGTQPEALTTASYLSFVEAYRTGASREPIVAVAVADEGAVGSAVDDVVAGTVRLSPRQVRAAALLHTDIATGGYFESVAVQAFHIQRGRQLLESEHAGTAPGDFYTGWATAIAWHHHWNLELAPLARWLDLMLRRDRDHPEVALALGSFYEVLGWTSRLEPKLPWNDSPRVLEPVADGGRGRILERAAEILERASHGDGPAALEARLRLGRIQNELGQPALAVETLSSLFDEVPRHVRYLAHLFAAAAEERQGHLEAAGTMYVLALGLYPQCQTPRLGLSMVRSKQDRPSLATQLLESGAIATTCEDPWWDYKFGPYRWRMEALMHALKQQVME